MFEQVRSTYDLQGNPNGGYTSGNRSQVLSHTISDAAMHETYMLPFAEAVREGSASIMCSYNEVNGTAACESPSTIGLIKDVSPPATSELCDPSDPFFIYSGTQLPRVLHQ